jgi:cation diffusion facilitator CzcD-associated flavoprotein CzcO
VTHHRTVIVGTGFSGIGMAIRLLKDGDRDFILLERAHDIGGTWRDNTYPGCRCDVPSHLYSFSFAPNPDWSNTFSPQPEILDYLRDVARRFGVLPHVRFDTELEEAEWDEDDAVWRIETSDGPLTADVLVTAPGPLSDPLVPELPGLESFEGTAFHSARWDHDHDLTGKRVAVIGTGATGIQAIPEIAKQAAQLYVFQRTPNYDIPARNAPLEAEYVQDVKADYPELWEKARASGFGLPYQVVEGSAAEAPPEERQQRYQRAWDKGGFYIGLETYSDFLVNKESNDTISEFIRARIRETVHDPAVAELLAPSDHPFFTKRPPLETNYYATYNRDNVELIDINRTPIATVTPAGLRTSEREYEVDAIVFATGFDTMTGTLFKMGIIGRDGLSLKDKWADGPSTYLGLTTHGFPNLFMITGPQSPSVLSNMPVAIEQNTEWIAGLIGHMREVGADYSEATAEAERGWVEHHNQVADATLLLGTNSWWVGANIPGKPRTLYPYVGGVGAFRDICADVARKGYEGITLTSRTPAR